MRRILVVDDDESIRDIVAMALGDEGYEVATASDGVEALEEADRWQPDLILLDMKMPRMDGWAFSREYRKKPSPRAEIIVLTAARDASVWAAEVEADGVLAKPFELDALYELVEQHAQPEL